VYCCAVCERFDQALHSRTSVAVCCSVLQCVALRRSVLQCVAVRRSVLQRKKDAPAASVPRGSFCASPSPTAAHCNTLLCCSVLQCVAKKKTKTRQQRVFLQALSAHLLLLLQHTYFVAVCRSVFPKKRDAASVFLPKRRAIRLHRLDFSQPVILREFSPKKNCETPQKSPPSQPTTHKSPEERMYLQKSAKSWPQNPKSLPMTDSFVAKNFIFTQFVILHVKLLKRALHLSQRPLSLRKRESIFAKER